MQRPTNEPSSHTKT